MIFVLFRFKEPDRKFHNNTGYITERLIGLCDIKWYSMDGASYMVQEGVDVREDFI